MTLVDLDMQDMQDQCEGLRNGKSTTPGNVKFKKAGGGGDSVLCSLNRFFFGHKNVNHVLSPTDFASHGL